MKQPDPNTAAANVVWLVESADPAQAAAFLSLVIDDLTMTRDALLADCGLDIWELPEWED